jgi:hypothetical protein
MSPFRATDEQLDREIGTLSAIVRLRRRRAEEDLDRLEKDLDELRRERRRRRGATVEALPGAAETSAPA